MNKLTFQIRKPGEVRMGDANVLGDVTLSEEDEGTIEEEDEVVDMETNNNSDSEIGGEEGEVSEVLSSVKRKSKDPSPVWEAGGKKTDGGSMCMLCSKTYKSGNSTSMLTKHILIKHKKTQEAKKLKELSEAKKSKALIKKAAKTKKITDKRKFGQASMLNFTRKSAPIDPFRKKKIDEAVVELLVINNEAMNLVEKHSFRKLLHVLEPSYICNSATTFRKKIIDLAEVTKKKLVAEVKKDLAEVLDPAIHLTSDHGTGGDKMRSHKNVLTISRCTKDFVIKTDIVAVMICKGSQTGDVIRY